MPIPLRWSASQLVRAAECEFEFVRSLEGSAVVAEDSMLERTADLGDKHEERVLAAYQSEYGPDLVKIPRPGRGDDARDEARALTLQAVADKAAVIFQAAILTDTFTGFADFLVRQDDGRYRIQDTKLARSSKVSALLQVAAYADHLREIGVDVDELVDLVLGDGTVVTHALKDVEPVYRVRRRRVEDLRAAVADGALQATWGDSQLTACGRCETCSESVAEAHDLLLVANLSVVQRRALRAAGILTIHDLAASTVQVSGIGKATLENLRLQARLQLKASPEPHAAPPFDVVDADRLSEIPAPSAGDIFFDFEGDPLYNEGGGEWWGLDYLFGWVDAAGDFDCLWAHDFDSEKVALRRFLDFVAERRAQHPDMHIYHYASYEKTHLISLSARHAEGEAEVVDLLEAGVLVDLYPIVRRAVRVGSRSYSIKKLEPLYMGDQYRDDDGVTSALGSVDAYVEACRHRDDGDDAGWEKALHDIADYNEYDCVSTLRLRDWLLALAVERGVAPAQPPALAEDAPAEQPDSGKAVSEAEERRELAKWLREWAGAAGDASRSPDQKAIGLVAAAVEYHDREERVAWADHFKKRSLPLDELALERNVFVADRAEVVDDWHQYGERWRRHLRLTGSWAAGSDPDGVTGVHLAYSATATRLGGSNPVADLMPVFNGTLQENESPTSILVRENLPVGQEAHSDLPVATFPRPQVNYDILKERLKAWADGIANHLYATSGSLDGIPPQPLLDVFRQIPPRTLSGTLASPVTNADGDPDTISAIVESLLDLDHSYLAVQGPPGTGKTYTAGHVIARLVNEHGWRIGVVAQTHKVIENALGAVARAGLPKELIGKKISKKPPVGFEDLPWKYIYDKGGKPLQMDAFLDGVGDRGYVYGATAWGHKEPYDLLVVDEAGQFSLAMTAATATDKAQRILFLGDPQQLPQVTQASHPEPVDAAALGVIADGHAVLPETLGYFLAQTRRMRSELTRHVSRLQYEDTLVTHPVADRRSLDRGEPGLHSVPIKHRGNVQASQEEADAVVTIINEYLDAKWTDEQGAMRVLDQNDFIVVTPYNAQRSLVTRTLADAGLSDVPVGTVDKFQGQEAVIAIVTMAASDATEAPRGMDFLIDRNRLNVAISRAKWAAFLVHSPYLLDHLPPTPAGVARLSAFAAVAEPA